MTAALLNTLRTGALGSLVTLSLTGCSAFVSTTNTTADAIHTVAHGVSVSSRSSTNVTSGGEDTADTARTRAFVESQHLALQREAAAGGGEHIQSLAQLLDADDSAALGQWMQSNYGPLFESGMSRDQLVTELERHAG